MQLFDYAFKKKIAPFFELPDLNEICYDWRTGFDPADDDEISNCRDRLRADEADVGGD